MKPPWSVSESNATVISAPVAAKIANARRGGSGKSRSSQGVRVGTWDGLAVVGVAVKGFPVGKPGRALGAGVGRGVGFGVGFEDVGVDVGLGEGAAVGLGDGADDAPYGLVGEALGDDAGSDEGRDIGLRARARVSKFARTSQKGHWRKARRSVRSLG